MSTPAADGAHEFVVARELAEVAERLDVPLHAGDRVRFEVIEGGLSDDGPTRYEPWPPAWVDSIVTDDEHLATRARDVMRAEFGASSATRTCPSALRTRASSPSASAFDRS